MKTKYLKLTIYIIFFGIISFVPNLKADTILFESEKQSYTNDYFRVSLLKKKIQRKRQK